jgi:hypothetical protein
MKLIYIKKITTCQEGNHLLQVDSDSVTNVYRLYNNLTLYTSYEALVVAKEVPKYE